MIDWLLGGPMGADGRLAFLTPEPLIALAAAVALVALAVTVITARRSPPVGLEVGLFAAALAVLVAALAGPVWIEEDGHIEPPRYAVLIDDSRSMSVLEGGAPRSEQVQRALDRIDGERVEVFRFGAELTVGGEPTFTESSTDIGRAFQAISERYAGEKLAGVALITDGLDRGGLRRRYQDEAEPVPPALPGPLTIYQVGRAGQVTDLSIDALKAGGFAFIHTPFTLTATLASSGFAGRKVPVTLTRDGQLVQERSVTLDEAGGAEVTFNVTARRAGRFIYEVSVPAFEGDAVPGNNSMPVAVRVVRDRLRVLQVCGSPSFDQKFLRLFLKQDPAVDLVSFFILRTNEDTNTQYTNRELSLIKFPYEQLFSDELDTFDLVIFQNFDYKPYFGFNGEPLLENIAQHVRSGKAFVMIGGDRSFDLGEYANTPLARVLPVRLGLTGTKVDEAGFRPALTAQGRAHPVTRLLGDAVENRALWDRLSPLDGLNLSAGAAPNSAVLLAHPTLKTAGGDPMPVVAVREVGRGRTMALMGDSSWRWVMAEAASGHGNQAYLRFWKNAFRWLVRDPEGERVQVSTGRENYLVGDTVRVVIQVRDVGFDAVEGAEVIGTITGPEGAQTFEGRTDVYGEAVVEVAADARGPWKVEAEARADDARLGVGETVFAVTARDPELDEVSPDEAFLARLAETIGGTHYTIDGYGDPLWDDSAGRRVDERVETPLWSAPLIPLLLGVLLSLSWWLRRRRGLR
ncbi:MAG: hypothetical protein H6739_23835 [Alphaproteobacteria bacterium]|nr:hypothetical protein [Alphaproteobacteria bacterium]